VANMGVMPHIIPLLVQMTPTVGVITLILLPWVNLAVGPPNSRHWYL